MPDPRIVNLRDFPVRAGRIVLPEGVVRIDRVSRWGNPFRIGRTEASLHGMDGSLAPVTHMTTRHEAIAAYRQWLISTLFADPHFLEPLRGYHLACWCAPFACHGEVIIEALDAPSIAEWLA